MPNYGTNIIFTILRAFVKFDELNKKIEEKDLAINGLKNELENMKPKSPVDTSEDASSATKSNSLGKTTRIRYTFLYIYLLNFSFLRLRKSDYIQ